MTALGMNVHGRDVPAEHVGPRVADLAIPPPRFTFAPPASSSLAAYAGPIAPPPNLPQPNNRKYS